MRTLKKTLCLVLALVLCFGLVGTAFAASNFDEYKDADTVGEVYKEAVDVMLGIGVVDGMSATEIGATGTFTREQAAKILAYMKLGKTAADALKADAAPFDDVAASKWSAGYISYCVEANILKGYGDGKFGPADQLTGYQFAAALLRAVGYGVNKEYEGSGWSIKVAQDAIPLDMFKGDLGAATNDPIQRQQAMLMAFNALTAIPTVKWSSLMNDYVYTNSTALGVSVDASFLVDNFNVEKTDKAIVRYQNTTTKEDGFFYIIDANRGRIVVDGIDYESVGRTAYTWIQYKNPAEGWVSVAGTYYSDKVVAEKTDGVGFDTAGRGWLVESASNANYVGDLAANCTYFLNGVSCTYAQAKTAAVKGAKVVFISNDTDAEIEVVQVFADTTAEITNAPVTRTVSGKTQVSITGITPGYVNASDVIGYEDLVRGDVVLFHKFDNKYYIEKAATITGAVTNYNARTGLTVGGNVCEATGLTGLTALNLQTVFNTYAGRGDVTFYVDAYGYLISASTEVAPLESYIVVLQAQARSAWLATKYDALVAKMDGTIESVVVDVPSAASAGPTANTLYTYSVNESGEYVLTAMGSSNLYELKVFNGNGTPGSDQYKVTSKQVAFLTDTATTPVAQTNTATKTIVGNAETVFSVWANANSASTTVTTGVSNAPTFTADETNEHIYVVSNKATGLAGLVLMQGNNATNVTGAKEYVYITNGTPTAAYIRPGVYSYTYTTIDGTVVLDNDANTIVSSNGAGLYEITQYADGYVHAVTKANHVDATGAQITYSAGTMHVNNSLYVLSNDVLVYSVDYYGAAAPIAASAVYALDAAGDYDVYVQTKSANDGTVTVLYIQSMTAPNGGAVNPPVVTGTYSATLAQGATGQGTLTVQSTNTSDSSTTFSYVVYLRDLAGNQVQASSGTGALSAGTATATITGSSGSIYYVVVTIAGEALTTNTIQIP